MARRQRDEPFGLVVEKRIVRDKQRAVPPLY
jgi:hypothetical protein